MTMLSTPTPAITAAPTGGVTVTPERARRFAVALATGRHLWAEEGRSPLALPTDEGHPLILADRMEEAGTFHGGWRADFYRPLVTEPAPGVFTWQPWSGRYPDRFITINTASGRINWSSGTGQRSRFIGEALIAAAGGLSQLPHGVVRCDMTIPSPTISLGTVEVVA